MKCRNCHKECQKISIRFVDYWWCVHCKVLQNDMTDKEICLDVLKNLLEEIKSLHKNQSSQEIFVQNTINIVNNLVK